MTVMAAEAGAGAVEGEAAAASTAGRQAASPRTSRRQGGRQRAVITDAPRRSPRQRVSSARRSARESYVPGMGGTNYENVILGEFLLAVLLVATVPFAKTNRAGVSPYAGQDLVQVVAIVITYFLLAILAGSGGSRARFAAWFGGLILLGIGLGETTALVKTLSVFGGTNAQTGTATGSTAPTTTGDVTPAAPFGAADVAGPILGAITPAAKTTAGTTAATAAETTSTDTGVAVAQAKNAEAARQASPSVRVSVPHPKPAHHGKPVRHG